MNSAALLQTQFSSYLSEAVSVFNAYVRRLQFGIGFLCRAAEERSPIFFPVRLVSTNVGFSPR